MRRAFASEAALLDHVARYFLRKGAAVYAEVPVVGFGRADLVALFPDNRIIPVEGKNGDGWLAYYQARRWAGRCHESYVAVPAPAKRRSEGEEGLFEAIADAYHHAMIGRLEVSPSGYVQVVVDAPRFTDPIDCGLRRELRPERLWTPGAAGRSGAPANPAFDELRSKLLELLDVRPKISAANAYDAIGAGPAFIAAVREDRIAGVRLLRGGHFQLVEEREGAAA